jgi:hypothetical protein
MEEKIKYNTSQLLNYTTDSYLERTSRPFYALVFLLPFIIFYELGTIFINTDVLNRSQVRVVAFVWLQKFLLYIGFSDKFAWAAPALAIVIILLALQIASHKKWYFTARDFLPMSVECILFAVPLVVFSMFLNGAIQQRNNETTSNSQKAVCAQRTLAVCYSEAETYRRYESDGSVGPDRSEKSAQSYEDSGSAENKCPVESANKPKENVYRQKQQSVVRSNFLADIVTSIGAGIYEELVFRLVLICLLIIVFQNIFQVDHKNAIIFSVLASAALFSAYHHIDIFSGQPTEPFNSTVFGFRVVAGIYFAIVFATRGFAITAGTHAFYDIIVVFVNSYFVHQ